MVVPGFAIVVGTVFHVASQWHRQLSWALALILEFYMSLLNFPSTRRERKGTDHYTEHALPLVGQRPQAPGDGKL